LRADRYLRHTPRVLLKCLQFCDLFNESKKRCAYMLIRNVAQFPPPIGQSLALANGRRYNRNSDRPRLKILLRIQGERICHSHLIPANYQAARSSFLIPLSCPRDDPTSPPPYQVSSSRSWPSTRYFPSLELHYQPPTP